MSALHSTCAPMQMTWWYLTYFDITDHNDIDIDYDLTKQHLSQFLSWWRRVFFLSDICRFSAIAWFLQFFAHLCTSVHLSRFFKMAGFSEIASILQANKSCFQAQPLQAEKSCYLRIWSWANRVLLNVMFPVQTFKQWELLCKPVPWRPGSFGCKKQKASAQKESLSFTMFEQVGAIRCCALFEQGGGSWSLNRLKADPLKLICAAHLSQFEPNKIARQGWHCLGQNLKQQESWLVWVTFVPASLDKMFRWMRWPHSDEACIHSTKRFQTARRVQIFSLW